MTMGADPMQDLASHFWVTIAMGKDLEKAL
jgi:hypothetical protein